jgi:DnaK suppressor protein
MLVPHPEPIRLARICARRPGPRAPRLGDGTGRFGWADVELTPVQAGYCDGVITARAACVLLELERRRMLNRLRALAAEFEGIVAASLDANCDDEHDPEGATIAFERERTAALRGQVEAQIRDVDRALARVAAGEYGFCRSCRCPIATERLRALPVTELCIGCAGDLPIVRCVRL